MVCGFFVSGTIYVALMRGAAVKASIAEMAGEEA